MEITDPKIIQGLIAAVGMLAAALIYLLVQMSKLRGRYDKFMEGSQGNSLEDMCLKRLEQIDKTREGLLRLAEEHDRLHDQVQGCVQHLGVVRFNAYNDIAGDLSYAVAALDEQGNGVIFSGIISRYDARAYAKPVDKGASNYNLSKEEQQALDLAKSKGRR